MRPQLYCDIDSTVNDHWKRIQRKSKDGVILPSSFFETEVMQDKPLPGAAETLKQFAQDWDVHFLSSRNWPDARRITEQWLSQHGFPFTSINIVNSHHEKIGFLKEHWCDLYIDDFTGGQEFGGPPAPIFYGDIVEAMPCPYEVFKPEDPRCWQKIGEKYFALVPNGEIFWQLQRRNLEWWRVNREFERTSRARYYDNFCQAVGLTREHLNGKYVGEIGAGPFGGLLRHLNPNAEREVYIDILANAQRVLRFIDWPKNSTFIDSPVEHIDAEAKSIDVMLSYNAIDHGSDVIAGLNEIVRVSKECFIAFDCKGHGTPPHDRLDHYQVVEFEKVVRRMISLVDSHAIDKLRYGNLCSFTPKFHFEHNWGFPVFFCHAVMP